MAMRTVWWSLLVHMAACSLSAGDWPHWRGPSRNGVVEETSGWTGSRWVNSEPAWTAVVGEGASSPLAVGAEVYAFGHHGGKDHLQCLAADTGKEVWTVSAAAPPYGRHAMGDEGLYSGPSSTPEYDPDTGLLYTLGLDGDLRCWEARHAGRQAWHRNLYADYQMPRRPRVGRSGHRDYGYTAAPFVHKDWLLVEAGAPSGTIVAFDKRTGEEAWRSKAADFAGHTGGMSVFAVENTPCAAVHTFAGLLVVRLDQEHAGETVARHPWVTDFANNVASASVSGDSVLITSEYNQSASCRLKVAPSGAQVVWKQPHSSKACTPVLHGNRVYMAWNTLKCLDWDTGELVWEGPEVGDAGSCIVTRDEKLIVWAGRGELFLVDLVQSARDRACRELARVSRLAQTDVWPHVALANGRIFCRDRTGRLMCFLAGPKDK